MRLGILTFHSQTNYGGVLQAFALSTFLKGLGVECVALDRWMSPRNEMLCGILNCRSLRAWIAMVLRSLRGCHYLSIGLRQLRTRLFLKRRIGLTRISFRAWDEISDLDIRNEGVCGYVVGSDQVWNCVWQDPGPYLLEGAPPLPAIGYAISLGMNEIPTALVARYRDAAERFSAVSVRENEALAVLKVLMPDKNIVHVADPTLLLERGKWYNIVPKESSKKRRIVCYFIAEDVGSVKEVAERYAASHNYFIEILVNSVNPDLKIESNVNTGRVRLCFSSGPLEFLKSFARADACVTDSFHAVMFSYVYGLNCRFVCPTNTHRKQMFARIQEFEHEFTDGRLVCASIESAFATVNQYKISFNESAISRFADASREWLAGNVKSLLRGCC